MSRIGQINPMLLAEVAKRTNPDPLPIIRVAPDNSAIAIKFDSEEPAAQWFIFGKDVSRYAPNADVENWATHRLAAAEDSTGI